MKIELAEEEIQLVMNGLGELQAKVSVNLMIKINAQIQQQKKETEKKQETNK